MKRIVWMTSTFLIMAQAGLVALGQPPDAARRPDAGGPTARPGAPAEALAAATWLEKLYDGQPQPEAVRMFIAIARGSMMGPGDGWFGPAQSRYGWPWLAKLHQIEGPAAIARDQFKGPPALFDVLDRNADGRITPDDLDWSDRNPYVQQLSMVTRWFRRMDGQGDGKLTRDELLAFFDRAARGKDSLSSGDLARALLGGMTSGFTPGDAPDPATLMRGLFAGEIGSMNEGPHLNQPAPDFTLKTHDGQRTVHLGSLVGTKPIVLVFGNFTCGPFRAIYPQVEEAYDRFKDQAHFVLVYVREAHPTDGWKMESNSRQGVAVAQPKTDAERIAVANQCAALLKPSMPFVVDQVNDHVGHAYSGMPARLYVIDVHGQVAYKSGRGPFGFRPGEMEQALAMALMEIASRQKEAAGAQVEPKAVDLPPPTAKSPAAFAPLLSAEETWRRLPPLETGEPGPLPTWARALAHSLPRTTAHLLELDNVQRMRSPLDPQLRGLMRLVAAQANRCAYTEAYALADLERAGLGRAEALRLASDGTHGDHPWRRALEFAEKMTLAAYAVTDEEAAKLVKEHGEQNFVAMVHLLAYANFQDRLVQALGLAIEEGGPLPPLAYRFAFNGTPPAVPARRPPGASEGGAVPDRITDSEWLALDFDALQKSMEAQRVRPARVSVPTWEELIKHAPPYYPRNRPSGVRWSLASYHHQPELTHAWLSGMRAFGQEAKQDRVFEECFFWVVTRSLHCYY